MEVHDLQSKIMFFEGVQSRKSSNVQVVVCVEVGRAGGEDCAVNALQA